MSTRSAKTKEREIVRTFRDGTTVVNASALIRSATVKEMLTKMSAMKFKKVRKSEPFDGDPLPSR